MLLYVLSSGAAALQPAPPPGPTPRKEGKPNPDAPGPEARNVGRGACGAPVCHGATVEEFDRLRHSHYVSDRKNGPGAGCETCHGPASDHLADPEHRKTFRFTVRSPENARRIDDACLRCHVSTLNRPHYQATAHTRAGLSCATCHEVHYDLKTPYLLRYPGTGGPAGQPQREPRRPVTKPPPEGAAPAVRRPKLEALARTRVPVPNWRSSFTREPEAVTATQAANELCASCHRREAAEVRQFSHHPVLEGRVNCTDCHNPHRAERGRMLAKGTIEGTCVACHEQRRGPFLFEHDPVRAGGIGDSCLECHRPHGSPSRNLQVMSSRGLCVQCHTDIQRDPFHRPRGGDCWRSGCHVAIHGSNHSPLFFEE